MGLVGLLELVLVLASLMLKLNQNPCLVFTFCFWVLSMWISGKKKKKGISSEMQAIQRVDWDLEGSYHLQERGLVLSIGLVELELVVVLVLVLVCWFWSRDEG
jgi:hypothetical protein